MELENKNIQVPEGITEIWQRIVDSLAIFLSVPCVMINRLDPPELEVFRSNTGQGGLLSAGRRMPMDGLYCTDVAVRRQNLRVNGAESGPRRAGSPASKTGIIAYLGVPLQWPDGVVFGTLCAVDTSKKEWDDKAENLLRTLRDVIESHLYLIMNGGDLSAAGPELEHALNEVLTLHGFIPVNPGPVKLPGDRTEDCGE